MNFTWLFSPNFLRGKKIAFNTFVLKNSPKYALFLSCFLPETALIAVIHDASQTQKDTEANLMRPLASLLTHVSYKNNCNFFFHWRSCLDLTDALFVFTIIRQMRHCLRC